jgi:hypothetical protein
MGSVLFSGTMSVILTEQVGRSYLLNSFVPISLSLADEIVRKLRERLIPRGVSVLYSNIPRRLDPPIAGRTKPETHAVTTLQEVTFEHASMQADDAILYVGGESLGLTNLLMTHASCEVSLHLISPYPSTALRRSLFPYGVDKNN